MKLWILKPRDENGGPWMPWYDKVFGFVVRSKTEEGARALASKDHRDEGKDAWLDSKLSTCAELAPEGKAEIIMRGFE